MSDINIRIGGDNSDYKRALQDSEAASVSFNQKVAAHVSAQADAENRLAVLRGKNDTLRAAGFNKDIFLQREIIGLKAEIAAMENGSIAQIEKKIILEGKVLQLEQQIAAAKAQQNTAGSASTASVIALGNATEATARKAGGLAGGMTRLFSVAGALKGAFSSLIGISSAMFAPEIADRLARWITGFSKAEEAALNATVASTEKGAQEQEAALEKLKVLKEKEAQEDIDRTNSTLDIIRDARLKSIQQEKEAREEAAKAEAKNDFDLDLAWVKEQDRIAAKKKMELENIAAIEAAKRASADEVARVEKARIDEMFKSYIDQWSGLQILIGSKGRGDTDLTDRELERKISNISSELEASRAASQGTFLGPLAFSTGSTALSDYQRSQGARAQQELDFRNQVRQAAATSGEDAAFRQFSGLSEQRFREILQSAPGTQDVVAELKKLNGALKQGIPTVLFGSETNT
jgi:hypothetical protein